VARLIVASALERRESRGAHYRSDFPFAEAGPLFTVRVRQGDGAPLVRREPVALTRLAPPPGAPARVSVEIGD
jgi:succinate dehydrogenase/fumarate reductase flavoprotein subunit